ncbi:uncharacterized protein LOC119670994 [Teleopsis dalmanni]|uniref:uncharacterized protein LOC119670994 n=1 Tax=Teleopsis dalmanni TaxID=139649 RepID=UPI0018CDCDA4|nr:uncharacterized protein LOC119670994 [Teleopsis dalmanni]
MCDAKSLFGSEPYFRSLNKFPVVNDPTIVEVLLLGFVYIVAYIFLLHLFVVILTTIYFCVSKLFRSKTNIDCAVPCCEPRQLGGGGNYPPYIVSRPRRVMKTTCAKQSQTEKKTARKRTIGVGTTKSRTMVFKPLSKPILKKCRQIGKQKKNVTFALGTKY